LAPKPGHAPERPRETSDSGVGPNRSSENDRVSPPCGFRHQLLSWHLPQPAGSGRGHLSCESRDCDVIVVGYTDGRIPWPLGRRPGFGPPGLILFGALAEAVHRENNHAVGYWWGVSEKIVSNWRKALSVGLTNAGTRRRWYRQWTDAQSRLVNGPAFFSFVFANCLGRLHRRFQWARLPSHHLGR